jgi:hypothetical protein
VPERSDWEEWITHAISAITKATSAMAIRIAGATHDAAMDLSIVIAHQFMIGLRHGISTRRCSAANSEPAVQYREVLITTGLPTERFSGCRT